MILAPDVCVEAVTNRNVAFITAYLADNVGARYVAGKVLHRCTYADFEWFMEQGWFHADYTEYDLDWAESYMTLLTYAVYMERRERFYEGSRAKLRYLIAHGADLEALSTPGDAMDRETPLNIAVGEQLHYATKQLLLAGASILNVDEMCKAMVETEWFPGRARCQRSVCVFMAATRWLKPGVRLTRDTARLVSRMLWATRYELDWYKVRERQVMKRKE